MTERVVFEVGNTWTSILEYDDFILQVLGQESKYPTPQAVAYDLGFKNPEVAATQGWDGWVQLLKAPKTMYPYFPTGLLSRLCRIAYKMGYQPLVKDLRMRPAEGFPEFPVIDLRDYQKEAVNAGIREGRGVFDMTPRCHALGDRLLDGKGEIIEVSDVHLGTGTLLSPDGKSLRVLERHEGVAELFRVKPRWGEAFTVTKNHVLVLEENVHKGTPPNRFWKRVFTEVTVGDWLEWSASRKRKSYLLSVGIDCFSESYFLGIDPYLLGVILGDGCVRQSPIEVTTLIPEILESVYEMAIAFGLEVRTSPNPNRTPTYRLSNKKYGKNALASLIRDLGLIGARARHKFIPTVFKLASRGDRLKILAGLLDTDGYLANGLYYEYSTASVQLSLDVSFVARSLGLQAVRKPKIVNGVTYWLVRILGDIGMLPLRVPHKKTDHVSRWRTPGRSSFKVVRVGVRRFVGFTVEGGRYLHHDFTVLHNSGKTRMACELHRRISLPTIWVAPTDRIVQQTVRVIQGFFGKHYVTHQIGSQDLKQASLKKMVVCTAATATHLPQEFFHTREMVIVDEWHHGSAKSYTHDIFGKCDHIFYRYGLTGTFFRSGTDDLAMHGVLANTIYKVTSREMLDRGYLVPTKVVYLPIPAKPKVRGAGSMFNGGFGKAGIHDHAYRNQLVASAALTLHQLGRKVLILVGTKSQGNTIARILGQFLPKAPPKCQFKSVEFLSTDRDRKIQTKIIDSYLDQQEVKILIGTSLLGEGLDLPNVDALVYARGEKAEVSLTQNAYRVCTALTGKVNAIIVDFADRHHRRLLDHSVERLGVFHREPTFSVEILDDPRELLDFAKKMSQSTPGNT